MKLLSKINFSYFTERFFYRRSFLIGVDAIAYIISSLFLLVFIYEHGFSITDKNINRIELFYNFVWTVFLGIITIRIFLETRTVKKSFRRLAWLLSLLLYLTVIPYLFKEPESGFMRSLWLLFHHKTYRLGILTLLSFFQVSYGIVRLLGRKTNPSLILGGSFLVIILIGTGLLLLPRSTVNGIEWIDALFMATSAVCVTGLNSVDIAATFTHEGQVIIMSLVQIGGLGVMTFTSFFGLFFMGHTTLYSQLAIRDMVDAGSLSGLFSTLLNILSFTLTIELVGMLFLFIDIHNTMGIGVQQELEIAGFHAVSGFCNAGFSILPGELRNEALLHGHQLFYLTIAFLIICGSVGFPILVNLRIIFLYHFHQLWDKLNRRQKEKYKMVHLFSLNTKIVLVTTFILIIFGCTIIGVLEWNNSLKEFDTSDKLVHTFFNAVSLRTAGFTSISLSSMKIQAFLVIIILMVIGGGAQSTAGGIKVNSFAVILLNLWSVVRGREQVEIFGRELSSDSIRRSNATVLVFILVLIIAIFTISFLEPEVSLFVLTFECASALSTSGSSLELTSSINIPGKMLLIFLMFIGRVGIITLLLGLINNKKTIKYRYPKEDVVIN